MDLGLVEAFTLAWQVVYLWTILQLCTFLFLSAKQRLPASIIQLQEELKRTLLFSGFFLVWGHRSSSSIAATWLLALLTSHQVEAPPEAFCRIHSCCGQLLLLLLIVYFLFSWSSSFLLIVNLGSKLWVRSQSTIYKCPSTYNMFTFRQTQCQSKLLGVKNA